MSFKHLTIAQLIDNDELDIRTGPFGTQLKASDYVSKGTPVINVRNIGFGNVIEDKLEYISDNTRDRLNCHVLKENDIVFGRKGAVERHSFIDNYHANWFQGSDCIRLRINAPRLHPRFLSYYFLTTEHKNFIKQQCSNGTIMASLNQSILKQINIPLPDLSEQKVIASTLSCIDDKIELNNRMNKTLQEMAQAIFKSWFVDFEPFQDGEFVDSELGRIPKGWEIIEFEKIVEVTSGYSYKGTDLQDSTCAMLTIKNFDRNGSFKVDGFKTITISERVKTKHYVQLFDVLVAHTDITQKADIIGNPILVLVNAGYEKMVFSMDLVKVSSKLKHMSNVVIYLLLRDDRFKKHALGYASGTTVIHLSKKAIPAYRLAFPADEKIIEKLTSIIDPIFQLMGKNINENSKLSQLRDTLLPKLMSGEIRVPVQED